MAHRDTIWNLCEGTEKYHGRVSYYVLSRRRVYRRRSPDGGRRTGHLSATSGYVPLHIQEINTSEYSVNFIQVRISYFSEIPK